MGNFFKKKRTSFASSNQHQPSQQKQSSHVLEENVDFFKNALFQTDDLQVRDLQIGDTKAALLFLESLCDEEKISEMILKPLLQKKELSIAEAFTVATYQTSFLLPEAEFALIQGKSVLVLDKSPTLYILNTSMEINRAIEESSTEQVVRGSHSGLVESMKVNIHLVRKRINHPSVVVKHFTLGKISHAKIGLMYVHDMADPDLVKEVTKRLNAISADAILVSGDIEEYMEDMPFSPFPQTLKTERPDRVSAQLMDGRVAVLVDGCPEILIIPASFFVFFQSPDDYNSRFLIGSFFRLLRLMSFLIAITLPAFYIAVISFHFEVIPIDMIFSVKSGLNSVPFPPLIEALFMQVTLELLKEAAIRLPRAISPTIGIVGGLVIGNAVVQANLVSNTMIVVVAITAISSFIVPANEMSTTLRILGFPIMMMAATFGFLGIVFALMLLLMHLCKLETFGMPYFTPFAPFRWKDLKDTIIRLPRWKLNDRPVDAHPKQLKQETNSREWKNSEQE